MRRAPARLVPRPQLLPQSHLLYCLLHPLVADCGDGGGETGGGVAAWNDAVATQRRKKDPTTYCTTTLVVVSGKLV